MDYKATLNLPKTAFPMKANLQEREPTMLAWWEQFGIYKRLRHVAADRPLWILHDGPPYANGNIHLGHVLNKVLKDVIVKWRTMLGFNAVYVPGWDCHGLPIEHQVDKELDRKSTRLNSSHGYISYAVFCLKKKNNKMTDLIQQDNICLMKAVQQFGAASDILRHT